MNNDLKNEIAKDIEQAQKLKTRKERKKATLMLRKKYNDDSIVIYSKKHIENRKEPVTKKEQRDLLKSKDLIKEIFAIINQYFPCLLKDFEQLTDTRNKSYIKYKLRTMLIIRLLALICGITTMNEMERRFNTEEAIKNISLFCEDNLVEIPNWQTIQDVIENLSYQEIEDIRTRIVKKIIRSKMFDKYKYNGCYQVLVDATGIASRDYNLNDNCLTRTTKSKKKIDGVMTEVEKVTYYKYVLEAKLVFGNIVISIDTEWIENAENHNENQKQDCEIKAFKRMAPRIKANYPKMKFIITGDALYATAPMMDICSFYKWNYIFNLKPDRLKDIASQFEGNIKLENETTIDNYYLSTNLYHKNHCINAIKYEEIQDDELVIFRYVTNLKVEDDCIEEIVALGRRRWKIENEGFNMQKNGTYCISHLSSYNENALRIHYLFIQIAHLIRQLLECGSIVLRKLNLKIKSEISFQLTQELISTTIKSFKENRFQLRFDD